LGEMDLNGVQPGREARKRGKKRKGREEIVAQGELKRKTKGKSPKGNEKYSKKRWPWGSGERGKTF